ncbi:MAG: peptidylprolyl isomerase [Hyphomicrobiaceae bacterium]
MTVNGVTIARADIAREVQHHPASKPVKAWFAAAQALVVRELLLQEARRLEIAVEPLVDDDGRRETDDESLVRQVVEQQVVCPEPDEATCRRYFHQNRQRFRSPDLFGVRHILLAAPPRDVAARAEARRHAEALITQLEANPSLFSALAEAHSACPSRTIGGSLGQISKGQTVPEFEAALANLPVGQPPTAPIETRYGFHVVMVDARSDGEPLPFELVRDRIAEWLRERAHHTAIHQYIAMLASRASISGIAFEGANSPTAT